MDASQILGLDDNMDKRSSGILVTIRHASAILCVLYITDFITNISYVYDVAGVIFFISIACGFLFIMMSYRAANTSSMIYLIAGQIFLMMPIIYFAIRFFVANGFTNSIYIMAYNEKSIMYSALHFSTIFISLSTIIVVTKRICGQHAQ